MYGLETSLEFFLQRKMVREVCREHPGGTSQNIMEVQNLSWTVTQIGSNPGRGARQCLPNLVQSGMRQIEGI